MENKLLLPVAAGIVAAFLLGYGVGQEGTFSPIVPESLENQNTKSKPEQNINVTQDWEFNDYPAKEWKIYTNDEYGFTLQYPAHYVYDENKLEPESRFTGVALTFGPPYEEVFKKPHSGGRKSASAFEVIVEKKGDSSLAEVMERIKTSPASEVMRIENLGATKMIRGFSAKKVSACYPNNICNYIYYFADDRYIYQITDASLVGKQMDRINFEKMISSFQLK